MFNKNFYILQYYNYDYPSLPSIPLISNQEFGLFSTSSIYMADANKFIFGIFHHNRHFLIWISLFLHSQAPLCHTQSLCKWILWQLLDRHWVTSKSTKAIHSLIGQQTVALRHSSFSFIWCMECELHAKQSFLECAGATVLKNQSMFECIAVGCRELWSTSPDHCSSKKCKWNNNSMLLRRCKCTRKLKVTYTACISVY